jgi:hypothetical protein
VGKLIGPKVDQTGLDAETKLLRIIISLKEGAATLRLNVLIAVSANVTLPNSTPVEGPASDAESTGDTAASTAKTATSSSTTAAARTSGATATAAATEEKLKYPYKILELSFDSAPPPLPVEPADTEHSS